MLGLTEVMDQQQGDSEFRCQVPQLMEHRTVFEIAAASLRCDLLPGVYHNQPQIRINMLICLQLLFKSVVHGIHALINDDQIVNVCDIHCHLDDAIPGSSGARLQIQIHDRSFGDLLFKEGCPCCDGISQLHGKNRFPTLGSCPEHTQSGRNPLWDQPFRLHNFRVHQILRIDTIRGGDGHSLIPFVQRASHFTFSISALSANQV